MHKSIQVKCPPRSYRDEEGGFAKDREPLSPVGSAYYKAETEICILGVFEMAQQISLPCLKKAISASLLQHKRFCSIPEEHKDGTLKWVRKTSINLDDHIVIPHLDSTNFIGSNDLVERYVASLAGYPPIDNSKPLWEVHVLNYKSQATMVFRVHHSIGDCISLMSLLLDSTRKYSNPHSKPTISSMKKSTKLGFHEFSIKGFIAWLWRLLLVIWNTIYFSIDAILRILYKDKKIMTSSKVTSSKDANNNHRTLSHLKLDIDDLHKIGKSIGGTINDVVMGIITAGLVCYLEQLQDEGKLLEIKKVSDIQMSALVPVNIRSPPGLHDVREMMKKENKNARWGNDTSVWLVPVPMVRQSQWLEFCRVSRNLFDGRKLSYVAQSTFSLFSTIHKFFGPKGLAKFLYTSSTRQTLLFSNVRGPTEEVSFADVKITSMFTTISGDTRELTIYLLTYAKQAEIVFLAGNESFVVPHRLSDLCAQAINKMKAEVLTKSVTMPLN